MPQDVWTQWNSTYDMLKFALAYHDAIDKATSEHSLKLHKYEMSENEWELVMQLQNCLKVHDSFKTSSVQLLTVYPDLQNHDINIFK